MYDICNFAISGILWGYFDANTMFYKWDCSCCFLKYFDFVQLDPEVKESFDVAYDNIYAFHVAQKLPEKIIENMKVFYIFFLVYSI
jgi:hypothetical protein